MRKFLTALALSVVAMIPFAAPSIASAGCTARWDAGSAPVYNPIATGRIEIDAYKAAAQCTSTTGDHYNQQIAIQEFIGGHWIDDPMGIGFYDGQPFNNTVLNKVWRTPLPADATTYGQKYVTRSCFAGTTSFQFRYILHLVNTTSGGTNDSATTSITHTCAG